MSKNRQIISLCLQSNNKRRTIMKKENELKQPTKKRKTYFRLLKQIMKIRYKEPRFVYLGEKFGYGGVILSNHEGTDAPMSIEIWNDAPTRMWGAHEMNSGLINMYKYQTRVYYHEKKHWNLHLARLFCLIASPLTLLFYSGLNLISTYRDNRFLKTLRESVSAIEEGQNIVIFPEDSTNGYLEELEGFHAGFVLLCESCLKKGIDVPVYVTYFQKNTLTYVVDAPIKYSAISQKYGGDKKKIADALRLRCNELGKMTFEESDQKNSDTATIKNEENLDEIIDNKLA